MAFEQPGGQAGEGREQYVIEFARTGGALIDTPGVPRRNR